jgi:glycosyltransferase involved in cell wall biosynthesis
VKILILNWKDLDHPNAGGAEVFTHEVAKRLARRGHGVTQFASLFDGAKPEAVRDNVRIVRRGGRLGVYRAAAEYWRIEADGAFDVVIDEINTRPFSAPRFVTTVPVVGLIYQLAREAWMGETSFPINFVGRYLLEPVWLRQYRSVPTITISESTADDLHGIGFEDVTIVPVGLSEACSLGPGSRSKEPCASFIFVGRLARTKRPNDALTAFGIIRRQLPQSRMWIVGDGYLRAALERSAPEGVEVLGRVEEAAKLDLMARAHVLLIPSLREGWGLVVLEANAMGTPAVGYDVHGVRDAIRNETTGLLVQPNPGAMAEGALRILRERYDDMRGACLRWARTFDWEDTTETFLGVLERARSTWIASRA